MDLTRISFQCPISFRVTQCTRKTWPQPKWGVSRKPVHVARSASASATAKLTKEDLVSYLASGCKPREAWRYVSNASKWWELECRMQLSPVLRDASDDCGYSRGKYVDDVLSFACRIGTEHEKLGYDLATKKRLRYDQIATILESIAERYGWDRIVEDGNTIGLRLEGQSVTLEPGGQFELSGATLETLHQTCAEVNSHLYQVKSISEEIGAAFLGTGFDPKWQYEDVPCMPKERYNIMKNYMPTKGDLGRDMMFRSCTIQVNLDFESEADMVEKFRIGISLQPVATALFANSPFKEGKATGYKSWRSHVWEDTDPDRCGTLPFVFEPDFGFERYVDYVLDVPMYFVYRHGKYINVAGKSFRDFMNGTLQGLEGEYPTMDDWESHLTTVFPEVRLKRFLEMRGADGGPWRLICALPALWVGLLYDEEAQRQAAAISNSMTSEEREYLRSKVPELALDTPFRDGTIRDLALEILSISRGGLERRGKKEEKFLDQLDDIAQSGKCQADHLLDMFYGEWHESVEPYYSEKYSY